MDYPEITDDQREMVVELLANAMRKDAHLRNRGRQLGEQGSVLHDSLRNRRSEPSTRYIEGMRDLLRVLFPNGQAVAEACLEEASARALGASAPITNNGSGAQYH